MRDISLWQKIKMSTTAAALWFLFLGFATVTVEDTTGVTFTFYGWYDRRRNS